MATKYWLIKSEPSSYSWTKFVKDGSTYWDGVRNYEARNNLRLMKSGALALFYHSVKEKAIVGIAKVTAEHRPDPTAKDGDWSVVDFAPIKEMVEPVTLGDIKGDGGYEEFALIRKSRLSVVPASAVHFKRVLKMGKTKL